MRFLKVLLVMAALFLGSYARGGDSQFGITGSVKWMGLNDHPAGSILVFDVYYNTNLSGYPDNWNTPVEGYIILPDCPYNTWVDIASPVNAYAVAHGINPSTILEVWIGITVIEGCAPYTGTQYGSCHYFHGDGTGKIEGLQADGYLIGETGDTKFTQSNSGG